MMSGPSGPSTLPAWKQALLDRKRRPGDPPEGAPTGGVESATGASAWKQTMLGKKLLKYTDQGRSSTGRTSSSEEGCIPPALGEAPEVRVVEPTGPGEDRLAPAAAEEERLLPIKQNPILLSDRQRRHRVKPVLPKTPPALPPPKTADSETHGSPSPSANHAAAPSYIQQPPGGGEDSGDEVFGEEVAYGKGFVHKLMQKFINLSGKDEPAPPATVGASKPQGRGRSSGENHGDGTRSSSGHYSNCNGEEMNASRSPAAESSMQNGHTAGTAFGRNLIEAGSKVNPEPSSNKSPIIDTEDLPQNIVSTTRDIFEHSGPAIRNRSAAEKSGSEQTTSMRRPAPEAPSADPVSSRETGDAKKIAGNANQAAVTTVSVEKPSGVATAAKSGPETKSHQVLPMNRVLYSASGAKKTSTQETPLQRSQITTGRSVVTERVEGSREHSVATPGHTQRKDHFSGYSVDSAKPGSDVNIEVGKVSSMVGSWGLKSSIAHDTADDFDDRVGLQDRVNEPTGAKIKQKQEPQTGDAQFNRHPKPGSQSDLGDGPSVKQNNNEVRNMPRSVGSLSGGTKVKVEPLSDGLDPDRMGQNRAQQHPIGSADNKSPVDILKDNSQPMPDVQKEIERSAEVDRMTTRIRIGGYASHPQPQIPSPGVVSPAHFVPTTSSIHTENQVTVVRIGGGLPPTMFQDNKAENEHRHLPQPIEGFGAKTDAFENVQNSIITEGRSTKITVGYDQDVSDSVYAKNSANGFNGFQNNAASNKVNIGDVTREDPFARGSVRSNDMGQRSDPKSVGVSRPGKLLIRPASNHPASKTKTEFLTLTKYNDITKGEFAPAKRPPVNKDELVNGDSVDRGRSQIDDLDQFVFIGGGVSVGKSLLTKTKRREKLRISFDDLAIQTHEYPSEQSLMAEFPPEPGYCDYVGDDVESMDLTPSSSSSSSGLLSSPALTAGEKLSSYVSRSQVDYTFGMDRMEDMPSSIVDPEPPQPLSQTSALAPDMSDDTTFSQDFSADLLF